MSWIIIIGVLVTGISIFYPDQKTPTTPVQYQNGAVYDYLPIEPDASHQEPEDCVIKGNISYNTGEKIYHLPGDVYYSRTVINEAYGEHWFCSEAEARTAGWRHSYR